MQGARVEVWTARPRELGDAACEALERLLDDDERGRAQRLQFHDDRRAYIAAHGLRRMALGMALARDPADLRFARGPHGQPVLLDAPHGPAFSLTRSRGFVACAIGAGCDVGVDAEPLCDGVGNELLLPYMAPVAGLDDLEGFYVQWTALEAYWKAQGTGLAAGQPRIALHASGDDCHDIVDFASGLPTGLSALRLPAPEGHVLSVACPVTATIKLVALDSLAPSPEAATRRPGTPCPHGVCLAAHSAAEN